MRFSCVSSGVSGVESGWKDQFFSHAWATGRPPNVRAIVDAFSEMGQRRWNRPGPGTGKEIPMQGMRMRGESAKQVAIDVLRAARKPLRTKEIAKRVIESGRCPGLK